MSSNGSVILHSSPKRSAPLIMLPHIHETRSQSIGPRVSVADIRLAQEINEAVSQMQKNIQLTSQRGERLDNLQDKTDALAGQASNFRRGANRVRKQMWWKDMKMRMCIIIGIVVLLVVIIVPSGELPSAAGV
jgi:hypothetical protein